MKSITDFFSRKVLFFFLASVFIALGVNAAEKVPQKSEGRVSWFQKKKLTRSESSESSEDSDLSKLLEPSETLEPLDFIARGIRRKREVVEKLLSEGSSLNDVSFFSALTKVVSEYIDPLILESRTKVHFHQSKDVLKEKKEKWFAAIEKLRAVVEKIADVDRQKTFRIFLEDQIIPRISSHHLSLRAGRRYDEDKCHNGRLSKAAK